MSKIICEICGTAYPDTAKECPICGFPHGKVDLDLDLNLDDLQLPEEHEAEPAVPNQKVKGGRFSNKNVKKRHEEEAEPDDYGVQPPEYPVHDDDGRKRGRGLRIAIAVLLVLVIAVGTYIGYRFWAGASAYDKPAQTTVPTTAAAETTLPETEPTEAPTVSTEPQVPCTELRISNETLEIRSAGRGWMLDVTAFPENTTDPITFVSSDPAVAEVSENGRITAVGPGSAVITITCGSITKECVVNCTFDGIEPTETTEETEKPTEEPTEPQTEPNEHKKHGFRLDRNDVTLFQKGESFRFGQSSNGKIISSVQVAWESSDPSVAKVDNGTVTAVGGGTCTITATYDGQTQKCIIRCKFQSEPEETTKPTEPQKPSDSNWKISHSDVTIKVGESFRISLTNAAGETANVSWSVSKGGIVDIGGNSVTGKAAGTVNVTATVDGKTYTCVVRVK